MAISATLAVKDGKPSRPAMILLDMDGTTSFLTGTELGATVVTQLAGSDVDASTAESFTSAEAMTPAELVAATCAALDADITGAKVWWAQNGPEEFVIHFEPIVGVADDLDISTAVFTAGS